MNICLPPTGFIASEAPIDWEQHIGAATARLIEQQLLRYKHPTPNMAIAAPWGLRSLAQRYGPLRLEAARALALSLSACNYCTVRDIQANGRDLAPPQEAASWSSPEHEHLRGAHTYH